MHERSYTHPFNLNGYELTATKNLPYLQAYWQEICISETETPIKKEAENINVHPHFLRKSVSLI
jgi:hypothetical protein